MGQKSEVDKARFEDIWARAQNIPSTGLRNSYGVYAASRFLVGGFSVAHAAAPVFLRHAEVPFLDTHNAVTDPTTAWRFTVPAGKDGIYRVVGRANFVWAYASGWNGKGGLYLYKNGSSSAEVFNTGVNGSLLFQVEQLMTLVAGDYIEFKVYQDNTNLSAIDVVHISIDIAGQP